MKSHVNSTIKFNLDIGRKSFNQFFVVMAYMLTLQGYEIGYTEVTHEKEYESSTEYSCQVYLDGKMHSLVISQGKILPSNKVTVKISTHSQSIELIEGALKKNDNLIRKAIDSIDFSEFKE